MDFLPLDLYRWCALIFLALLSFALFWQTKLVRASAWIVVAFITAWLAGNFGFLSYFLTQAKLQQNEHLLSALYSALSTSVLGMLEMYFAWVPLLVALLFGVFFQPSSNPSLNRTRANDTRAE